jgi:hypothetical protein
VKDCRYQQALTRVRNYEIEKQKEEIMKTKLGLFLIVGFVSGASLFAANAPRPTDAAVLQNYAGIHQALAGDSLKGVTEKAAAISKDVRTDNEKHLPASLAEHADKLAKDADLKTAREDFKNLSSDLITYLAKNKINGSGYHENFCPMVKASWLQKDKKINNPYLGKSMSTCGELKQTF